MKTTIDFQDQDLPAITNKISNKPKQQLKSLAKQDEMMEYDAYTNEILIQNNEFELSSHPCLSSSTTASTNSDYMVNKLNLIIAKIKSTGLISSNDEILRKYSNLKLAIEEENKKRKQEYLLNNLDLILVISKIIIQIFQIQKEFKEKFFDLSVGSDYDNQIDCRGVGKTVTACIVDALHVEEENDEVDLTKSVSRKNNKRNIDNDYVDDDDDDSIILTPIASKIIIKDSLSTKRGKKKRKLIENEEVSTPQNELSIRNNVLIEQKMTNDDSALKNAETYTCPSIRALASISHVQVPTCTSTRNEFQHIFEMTENVQNTETKLTLQNQQIEDISVESENEIDVDKKISLKTGESGFSGRSGFFQKISMKTFKTLQLN
jgi:hypothetical protein